MEIKKAELKQLLEKYPDRYKKVNYSGEIRIGRIMPVDGEVGMIIAIDYPKKESAVVDLQFDQAVMDNMGDDAKTILAIMDMLLDKFGSLQFKRVQESGLNGNGSGNGNGDEIILMEIGDALFSLVGNKIEHCIDKVGAFGAQIKDFNELFRKKQLREFVSQFK